jgi:hypothetical protein
MKLPPPSQKTVQPQILYIHKGTGRQDRALDDSTESFVDETRTGTNA